MKKIFISLLLLISYNCMKAQSVGIGVNSPTQPLDVAGNVKFSGALMPNNLPGTANDVLMSQGAGISPVWGDATVGQMWSTVFSSDSIDLVYDGGVIYYSLPGMTLTFSVATTGNFDAFLYTDGAVQWTSNVDSDNNSIMVNVGLFLDGSLVRSQLINVDNFRNLGSGERSWSICYGASNISSGSHTFEVKGRVVGTTGALPATVTFCDQNIFGNARLGSLSIALVRN